MKVRLAIRLRVPKRPPSLVARVVEEEYARFMMERFDRNSAGGGDWPNTKRGPPILVRTGALRSGVAEGVIYRGGTVRLRTAAKHPLAKMTIRKLADIHAEKGRRILVQLDEKTKQRILKRLRNG